MSDPLPTPPTPLDFVEAISTEASAIREDWSDPRGSLRLIQEYCDKLRAQLSETGAPYRMTAKFDDETRVIKGTLPSAIEPSIGPFKECVYKTKDAEMDRLRAENADLRLQVNELLEKGL